MSNFCLTSQFIVSHLLQIFWFEKLYENFILLEKKIINGRVENIKTYLNYHDELWSLSKATSQLFGSSKLSILMAMNILLALHLYYEVNSQNILPIMIWKLILLLPLIVFYLCGKVTSEAQTAARYISKLQGSEYISEKDKTCV